MLFEDKKTLEKIIKNKDIHDSWKTKINTQAKFWAIDHWILFESSNRLSCQGVNHTSDKLFILIYLYFRFST